MKFTLSWLQDHLSTQADLDTILNAMTMAGLEVEHCDNPALKLDAFTVAKILSTTPHPNADRLRVCQVETFEGTKEIVCGAPNARAGLTTIYAPLGTYIPGSGITLAPREVRGIVSNGMLCSAAELELADDSDGILELADGLPIGTKAAQAMGLDDCVIDFEVTPNRPDWLGVAGIARELAAAGLGSLKTQPVTRVKGTFPCPVSVQTLAPEACPLFMGRVIRNVRNGPSPAWLADRLRAIGLRPINALVDVTNFLTYDRARPLHVYDVARLTGGLVACMAQTGEGFDALDGKHYELTPDMCVIGDGAGVLGLGGIIGGASSGVSEATTDVFIESALFDPLTIAATARARAIQSDAKYRFERGVDPGFVESGLHLATALILEICGGEASDVVQAGEVAAGARVLDFKLSDVTRLTGLRLEPAKIVAILTDLGFGCMHKDDQHVTVTVPSWRHDVSGGADLVEDIARIAGFDHLPIAHLPSRTGRKEPLSTPSQNRIRLGRRALAARGWMEAVTWSFAGARLCHLFGANPDDARVSLANPIAADLDQMRPSALIHLLLAAGRNADRGYRDLALFEAGPIYQGDGEGDQRSVIAGVTRGNIRHWMGAVAPDVYSVKADVLAILEAMGVPTNSLQISQGAREWWHSGRAGTIKMGPKNVIAEFGEIHPRVLKAMDLDGPILAFELFVSDLPPAKPKASKAKPKLDLSPLMPLTRDFAFVVSADKPAADIVRAVAGVDKALIKDVRVFDRFEGAAIGAGQVSLALQVTLAPTEKTLTDSEIEALSTKIIAAVDMQGGRLR